MRHTCTSICFFEVNFCYFLYFSNSMIYCQSLRQPPPVYEAILIAVGTEALKPVLAAGEFVKSIGSQLSSTTKFLGGEAGEFVKDLGSVSKNIGNGLKDGVNKALDTIGSGFESLGNKFADLGNSLASGATDLANGLGSGTTDLLNGLGSEFTGLSGQLGGGLDSLGGSLTDLGNKLLDGVKNVGNSIGNTFGRKLYYVKHTIYLYHAILSRELTVYSYTTAFISVETTNLNKTIMN